MIRRVLVLGVATLMLIGSGQVASAKPSDALTEKSTAAGTSRPAVDARVRRNDGCTLSRREPRLTVRCAKSESVTLKYRFSVPGRAIDLRVEAPTGLSGPRASGRFTAGGHRGPVRGYVITVRVGRGTWAYDGIGISYELPTEYDTRRCVTAGEWTRIDVTQGGVAGTARQIAAVFDSKGKEVGRRRVDHGYQHQTRSYRRCGTAHRLRIGYVHIDKPSGWYSVWTELISLPNRVATPNPARPQV